VRPESPLDDPPLDPPPLLEPPPPLDSPPEELDPPREYPSLETVLPPDDRRVPERAESVDDSPDDEVTGPFCAVPPPSSRGRTRV